MRINSLSKVLNQYFSVLPRLAVLATIGLFPALSSSSAFAYTGNCNRALRAFLSDQTGSETWLSGQTYFLGTLESAPDHTGHTLVELVTFGNSNNGFHCVATIRLKFNYQDQDQLLGCRVAGMSLYSPTSAGIERQPNSNEDLALPAFDFSESCVAEFNQMVSGFNTSGKLPGNWVAAPVPASHE